MNNKASFVAAVLINDIIGPNISIGSPPKRASKCLLPKCEKYTTHNGGYCCAEHCKAHRRKPA